MLDRRGFLLAGSAALAAAPAIASNLPKPAGRFEAFAVTDNHAAPRAYRGDTVIFDASDTKPVGKGHYVYREPDTGRLFLGKASSRDGLWFLHALNPFSESFEAAGPLTEAAFAKHVAGRAASVLLSLSA